MRKRWIIPGAALMLGLVVWLLTVWHMEAEEYAAQAEALEVAVAALGEAQLKKHRDLAKWYNYRLGQGETGLDEIYDGILNFGNGRMGLLEVPEMNLRRVIYHGTAETVGHDPDSPLPIGGRGNHTVLTLTQWHPWEEGQAVYIEILDQRLAYRVESVQVMPAGWSLARPTEGGQDLLTLVYDRDSTRTIIRCLRASGLTVREAENTGHLMLAAGVLLVLPISALGQYKRSAKGKQMLRIDGFSRKTRRKSKLS